MSRAHILKNKTCFNMKSSTYYFHMETEILADFQICISVPLRKIKWWVQNGPITKNGVLPVTNLFFLKFCVSLRTSYRELIWCTNDSYAHIHIFCKRWSFIWRCFFSVTILNDSQGKTVFHLIQYKDDCLAASDLFHMFTQSIKFY